MAHKYQSWKKQGLNTYQVSLSLSLIAVLCITTFAAPKQEFDAEPVDTEVNPGQITKLTCKVRNIQSTCHWLKSDSRSGNFAIRSKIPGSYEYKTDPSDGDCSITILNTSLLQDDAFWQCQVTTLLVDQSNLLSNPVKLTVRNAPESPIIEHDGQQHGDIRYNSGDNFVAEADKLSKFTCVSRKGNPPAILKWFIDNTEITGNALQINETEIETPKTFRAISSLSYTFNKEHHDKKLKCVALHAAYPTGSLEVVVNLNISYIPVVKLEGTPTSDLKEGDQLTLKCIATANPPAKIIWKKSGNQNYGFEEVIKFNNIRRSDAGIYSCSARNTHPLTQLCYIRV